MMGKARGAVGHGRGIGDTAANVTKVSDTG
jgi:hypothetical protein